MGFILQFETVLNLDQRKIYYLLPVKAEYI